MEMNKMINKEEKQEDIIILDEGISTDDTIEILRICCAINIFPYRF